MDSDGEVGFVTTAPPDSVEALIFDLSIRVKSLGPPGADGLRQAEFDYHCERCGGYIITVTDPVTDDSAVLCKACGKLFGRWAALRALMRDLARRAVREG